MSAKFCAQCGAELPADASFCQKCGTPAQGPPAEQHKNNIFGQPLNSRITPKQTAIGCGVFAFIVILLAVGISQCSVPSAPKVELQAAVRYAGTQFIISNNNDFDWNNVALELNDTFALTVDYIPAGDEYSVSAIQFTKNDGTRFNPVLQKPLKFDITVKDANGQMSFWHGGW